MLPVPGAPEFRSHRESNKPEGEIVKRLQGSKIDGRRRRLSRTSILFASLLLLMTSILAIGPSGTAEARSVFVTADTGVYAITPQWWGWCPKGGGGLARWNKVTSVSYNNHTTGDNVIRDRGDDIVWMRVKKGRTNSVTVSVTCRFSHPQGMNYSIKPTKERQAWFFGFPSGTWSN